MTAPITPPNPFYVPLDRQVTLSLDGTWRFAPDPDDRGAADGWHRLRSRPRRSRSVGEPASGDVQRLPGDVVGLVTGQVDRHVGHVLGPLDPSDRHRRHRLRLE